MPRPLSRTITMSYWGEPITLDIVLTDPFSSDTSTEQTIHHMRRLVYESLTRPEIHSLVDSLLQKLPTQATQKDFVHRAYWWIKSHVGFCEDEPTLGRELGFEDVNQELLIAPWVLVKMPRPMGDCDDFSMLMATLCKAAGVMVAFVTVACEAEDPTRWTHVYCRAMVDGEVTNLDVSHGRYPGWETKSRKYREAEWTV